MGIWVLTRAVMFLELIFRDIFLASVGMKVVKETYRQLLQKACCVWPKYIDEDFAIN